MWSRSVTILGVAFLIVGSTLLGFELMHPSPLPKPTPHLLPVATPQATPPVVATALPPAAPPTVIAQGPQTRILMYHYIRVVDQKKDPLGYGLSVTPEAFESQLALFKQQGYQSLTMSQVAQGIGGPKTIALTFDDGYEDFYTVAFPLLQKYGFTATAYIISGMIGGNYMTWDQIRSLQAAGIEIGAHTVHHIDLATATPDVQRHEIDDSKSQIEAQVHVPVISFCYPSGKYTATTEQLVRDAGYTSATTTAPGQVKGEDDRFTLKRVRMSPGLGGADLLHEIQG